MKIKKGDKVKIIYGNSRGKEGVVEKVFPRKNSLVIAGVNIVKKHRKPRGPQQPGGIIEIAKPIPADRVMLICPQCQKPTRIAMEIKGNNKSRLCKKCGKAIKS